MRVRKFTDSRKIAVLLVVVSLALMAACSSTSSTNSSSLSANSVAAPGSVTYLDTDRFDENLSSLLAGTPPSVTVSFLDPPEVGEMPIRINTWLAAVEENGGHLNMEGQQENSKSASAVLALVALVKEGHAMYKESKKYSPSENYDATIMLAEDGVEVKSIEFIRREAG